MTILKIKRVYEAPEKSDGIRILVDRLWPRGISKTRADVKFWYKDIAPSANLREWFNHDEKKFKEFSNKYDEELKNNIYVDKIRRILNRRNVMLIYAAKDEKINHAAVLKEYIEDKQD